MFLRIRVPKIFLGFFLLILIAGVAGCRGVSTQPPPTVPNIQNQSSTSSPVKHVIVVVMQNSTFDHLFGTFPGANGPHPGVPGFNQADSSGNMVAPFFLSNTNPSDLPHTHASYLTTVDGGKMDKFAANNGDLSMGFYDNTVPGIDRLWGFAQQFALADNYFNPVLSSAPDDVSYMIAAGDAGQLTPQEPVYGPCQKPDPVSVAYTFPNVGDEMNKAGISWGWYQEHYGV